MARLLSWPVGLGIRSRKPLAGPRSLAATSNQETTGGRYQRVSSPFGLWRYEFVLPVATGRAYRRIEGLVAALHGGANAVVVPFPVPDSMSFKEAGVIHTSAELLDGVPWSNGRPWDNGRNWRLSKPTVPVVAPSAFDTTIIQLSDEFWGHALEMGDEIGFYPFHFGKYMVTQVISPGTYRIWPPLRKAVAPGNSATLKPILVMTLDGEAASTLSRGVDVGQETTLTMSEVMDYDVRDYFGD